LRGFRAMVLDARNRGIVALHCGPDQNGCVRGYHLNMKPERRCATGAAERVTLSWTRLTMRLRLWSITSGTN
jgi:hypothetical protein